MTSTVFNSIQSQTAALQSNQPLTLKQGQVFHGTVKKLYPDQMAEIQVGSQKLFAKLETPLKAGDTHFFQVTSMNPQAELKVVTGSMQHAQTSQQLAQLLESMNLPKTAEMQKICSYFLKNQLPIAKETLVQAETLLKNLPDNSMKLEALAMIKKMVETKMPFTKEIFDGLLNGSKTSGFAEELINLSNLLKNDSTILPQLKSNVLTSLQRIAQPFESEASGMILSKAVQVLLDKNANQQSRLDTLHFLKDATILPKVANVNNWLSQTFEKIMTLKHFEKASLDNVNGLNSTKASEIIHTVAKANGESLPKLLANLKTWVQEQPFSASQKEQIHQVVNRFESLPKIQQTIELFAKQLQEQFVKAFSESNQFELSEAGFSKNDHLLSLLKPESQLNGNKTFSYLLKIANESKEPFIRQFVTQVDDEIRSSMDGKSMEYAVKTILKSLGLSYEAFLNTKPQSLQEQLHSLKPQLVSLIQDSTISASVREASEGILSRLNGMQLHSIENGHQHQIVMQIPLHFFGKNTDATVQWNGRMDKNGKMSSDFVRILFYLNMESLKETMVDMQVQNRIVTINVYNEDPNLERFAQHLKDALKKGLLEKDYHLSGLFFKQFEKATTQKIETLNRIRENQQSQSGVDIRI